MPAGLVLNAIKYILPEESNTKLFHVGCHLSWPGVPSNTLLKIKSVPFVHCNFFTFVPITIKLKNVGVLLAGVPGNVPAPLTEL